MLHGLWRLTWLEIKIFAREPLGLIGSVLPAFIFIGLGRALGPRMRGGSAGVPPIVARDLPIVSALAIAAGAVLSLVTIVAVYREGGILRRLRATPLRPYTIRLRRAARRHFGWSTLRPGQLAAMRAVLHGRDVLKTEPRRASLSYRKSVQMIFQDPFGSLNPLKTVGHHIGHGDVAGAR